MNSKQTLLIVDDDDTIRELLQIFFHLNHYEVITAKNGREALEILKKQTVEMILVDLMMPVMDGLHLIMLIRQELKLLVPIVVLSGIVANEEIEKKAIDLGVSRVLVKPVDIKILLKELRSFLETKKSESELNDENSITQFENARQDNDLGSNPKKDGTFEIPI